MNRVRSGMKFRFFSRISLSILLCAVILFSEGGVVLAQNVIIGPGDGYLGTQGQNDQYTQFVKDNPQIFNPTSFNGTQANYFTTGQGGTSGGATGAGIGKGVGTAASCISSAQAIRIAKEALIKSNPSTYTKVNVTHTAAFSQTGESGQVGFDAIGYCLINAIIEFITQGVIAWANTAISGNPAFVNDPQRFYSDLRNQQTAGFLNDFQNRRDGLNISDSLRGPIARDIAYGAGGQRGYASGGGGLSNFWNTSQFGGNNYVGASLMSGEELARRQTEQVILAGMEVMMGGGFLPSKNPGTTQIITDANGNKIAITGNPSITAPGSVLNSQLNNRLASGNKRLTEANRFDQVVTQLVQALIKIILSQVLK